MSRLTRLAVAAILLAASVAVVQGLIKNKPDFIKTCYIKNKEEFPECSRQSVQGIFDHLKTGYPEAGIIPLDPLTITEIRILEGEEGPVSVNATLRNAKITGFGNVQIMSNVVDPKTYSFTTKMRLPEMRIDGQYMLKGRILVIPLTGHGQAWFEPHNMDVTTLHDVQVVEKKGRKYFNITDVHVDFSLGGLKLRMYNLYNGQKALEDSTNAYINANWKALADSMKPVLAKTIEDILLVIVRQLFNSVPAKFFVGDVE